MKNLKTQKGQALLIILLVMAVGLTIGLAVISRSVTDIRISRQEEESARVFSVAEAGIEEALKAGWSTPQDVTLSVGGIDITAHVVPGSLGGQDSFVFPEPVGVGDIQTVWLVEHNASGEPDPTVTGRYTGASIDLYWGNEGQAADQATTPALEATLIYKEGTTFKIKRGAYDPNGGRLGSNSFDLADVGSYSVGGKTFRFRKLEFNLSGSGTIPYVLRLRLLYNNQSQILGVKGTVALPSQGKCYESTASIPESGITRKVQQCQFHKAPPGIFDYVLYSEGDLVK